MTELQAITFNEFVSYFTAFTSLSDNKKSYLKAAFDIKFYSVISCERVAGLGYKTFHNWHEDKEFQDILKAILDYKQELRTNEENELKGEIKKDSLKVLHECITAIKKGKINKQQTPLLIFANKVLNDMQETQKNINENNNKNSGEVDFKVTGFRIV